MLSLLMSYVMPHISKILPLVFKLLPSVFRNLYERWLVWTGWTGGKDNVVFREVRLQPEKKGGKPHLVIFGTEDTNLVTLYKGNNFAVSLVRSYCGKNGDEFLDAKNPITQERLLSPIKNAITAPKVHAAGLGRFKKEKLAFALVLVEGGTCRQYRVLVVKLIDLLHMADLEQEVKAGKIVLDDQDTAFLVPVLEKMAWRYLGELGQYGKSRTIGQVTIPCRVHCRRRRKT